EPGADLVAERSLLGRRRELHDPSWPAARRKTERRFSVILWGALRGSQGGGRRGALPLAAAGVVVYRRRHVAHTHEHGADEVRLRARHGPDLRAHRLDLARHLRDRGRALDL